MTRRKHNRVGITLLELLIVATLMLMIMVISVPVIKPMLQSQSTSNAAQVVSTYLNRARTRAMTNNRPCGVVFERWEGSDGIHPTPPFPIPPLTGQYGASLILRQVEVPPPFAGFTERSTVRGRDVSDSYTDYRGNLIPIPMVQVIPEEPVDGDFATLTGYWYEKILSQSNLRIQFNGIGPLYKLDPAVFTYTVVDHTGCTIYPCLGTSTCFIKPIIRPISSIAPAPGQEIQHLLGTTGHTFKVLGDEKATMTAPVGLPQGTVVDLEYTGTDSVTGSATSVTIMFSPDGSVERVSNAINSFVPAEPIYILIGKWDRIAALGVPEDGITNLDDASNFWVSINPRTGVVSTNEVNPVPITGNPVVDVQNSRAFARQSKRNIGGN